MLPSKDIYMILFGVLGGAVGAFLVLFTRDIQEAIGYTPSAEIGSLGLLIIAVFCIFLFLIARYKEKKENEKWEIERFKKLILEMHLGFPKWIYDKKVKERIAPKYLQKLLEKDFLFKIKTGGKNWFGLMPNALMLVNSWKLEDLSNNIKNLTIAMIILMLIQTALLIFK